MEEPFEIETVINGRSEKLTVIPQEENFDIVYQDSHLVTICFNCDYQCNCTGSTDLDQDTLDSIATAIDMYYMLRH